MLMTKSLLKAISKELNYKRDKQTQINKSKDFSVVIRKGVKMNLIKIENIMNWKYTYINFIGLHFYLFFI